jgi:hypothetical protein
MRINSGNRCPLRVTSMFGQEMSAKAIGGRGQQFPVESICHANRKVGAKVLPNRYNRYR